MKRIKSIVFLVLLFLPFYINAQFQAPFKVISPVEDTWVDEQNPRKNYGDSKGHQCAKNRDDHNKEVYIKYNIQDLPECDSIILSFHCGFSSYNDTDVDGKEFVLQLFPVTEEWDEHLIDWKNKPKTAENPVDEIKLVQDKQNYAFSSPQFKSYIEHARAEGKKEVAFAFKGKNNTDGVKIWMHGKYWGYLNLKCYYHQTHDITLEIKPQPGCYKQDKLRIDISASEESDIFYTTDGSVPDIHSTRYTKPITINNNHEITAFAYNGKLKSMYYQKFFAVNPSGDYKVTVNASSEKNILHNFWNATGFSPAEELLQPDMRQACEYMGAIPNKGMVYVRPHYFLNLLAVEGINTPNPVYNWSRLDSAMDVLVHNGLKPIFEIMGSPSSNLEKFSSGFDENFQAQTESHETFFTNFHEREKVEAWKKLVKDLVIHFIERYGLEEVRSWYFESVNEPDYGSFWKHSEQEYLNYYDACSQALLEVDPLIRFGGPATPGALKSKYLTLLLAHCDTGTNYFTGKQGSRLDFISIHVKDSPRAMVDEELDIINYVKKNHPKFANLPFVNDEADPISGWKRDYWWRATPWHAAFIAQSVDLHYKQIIEAENVSYPILSNDNAFLGNWLNRTQFARFSGEKSRSRFSLVKKPAFTVFTLLSLMGNTTLESTTHDTMPGHLGILPTIHKDGRISVVLYNKTDIEIPNKKKRDKEKSLLHCGDENVILHVENLLDKDYLLIKYRIDEDNANPYPIWKKMGKPVAPDNKQLQLLRQHQDVSIEQAPELINVNAGEYKETISLPASSVCLVMLVPADIISASPKIKKLRTTQYDNINGGNDIMIRWNCSEEYVMTYEVWFSEDNKDFKKVNNTRFIDQGYLHTLDDNINTGYIKVRAIDYWNRKGPFSEILYFELK